MGPEEQQGRLALGEDQTIEWRRGLTLESQQQNILVDAGANGGCRVGLLLLLKIGHSLATAALCGHDAGLDLNGRAQGDRQMRFAIERAHLQLGHAQIVGLLRVALGGGVVAAFELGSRQPAHGFEQLRRRAMGRAIGAQFGDRAALAALRESGQHVFNDAGRGRRGHHQRQPRPHAVS